MHDERSPDLTAAGPRGRHPAPSVWSRVRRLGSVTFAQAAAAPVFSGWLEAAGPATNFDVLLDLSVNPFPIDVILYMAIGAQSTAGSGKVYRAQYSLTGGVLSPSPWPTGNPLDPSWSSARALGTGKQVILQAGGLLALTWSLELAVQALALGEGINNLTATGIAHGREL